MKSALRARDLSRAPKLDFKLEVLRTSLFRSTTTNSNNNTTHRSRSVVAAVTVAAAAIALARSTPTTL